VSPPRPSRPDLRSLPLEAIAGLVAELGEKPYRARQLFRWLHRTGAASLEEMTDLPAGLRAALAERCRLTALERAQERRSRDGTIKWTWRTADGLLVESVYMPHGGDEEGEPANRSRRTLCVSTQVGCAMGCTFCLTGTMGLLRNLEAGEIADQVHRANRRLVELGEGPGPRPLTNLVFMGMGEPLHNWNAVDRALTILNDPAGLGIGARHITVSTVGIVPALAKLAARPEQFRLALSLHAPTHEQRLRLMPVERKYPLETVLAALERFRRRVTFEYVMIAGMNDSPQDADRLAAIAAPLGALVNLLPLHPGGTQGMQPTPLRGMKEFAARLDAKGVTATVRRSRGLDIDAACGQLRVAVEGRRDIPADDDAGVEQPLGI
jgi:23S rRNA (adenine2503-C2)-methyltransferase